LAQFGGYPHRCEPPEARAGFFGVHARYIHDRSQRKVIFSLKKAAFIGHARSYTYGHFFTEILPHLVRLYETVPKDVPILYFAYNPVVEGVLRSFFEYGMWDPARFVVKGPEKGYVFVDELFVAPAFKSAEGMRGLRDFMALNYARRLASSGSLAPQQPLDGLQAIFQIREKSERHWDGVDLCQDTVVSLGKARSLAVNITRDEGDMSISRVIALYEAVHVLVGPHGAGLSNAIFLRSGSAVIEICHPGTKEYWRPDCRWFGDDFRAMGHRVISLLCKDCTQSGPLHVDSVELAELVLHFAGTLKSERPP